VLAHAMWWGIEGRNGHEESEGSVAWEGVMDLISVWCALGLDRLLQDVDPKQSSAWLLAEAVEARDCWATN